MKDPAFLFYYEAFLVGTMSMTHAERGKYIKLLCLQAEKGALSDRDMKVAVGKIPPRVLEKFERNDEGKWINVRLFSEINKRRRYVKSRQKNAQNPHKTKKQGEHMQKHMDKHMHEHMQVHRNRDINNVSIEVREEVSKEVSKVSSSTKIKNKYKEEVDQVIDHMNKELGTKYRKTTKTIRAFIRARLQETNGDTQPLLDVIEYQNAKWHGTKFAQYLRPETLFNATKFPGYEQFAQSCKEDGISPQDLRERGVHSNNTPSVEQVRQLWGYAD